jgi:peptidase M1-like protein
MRRLAFVPILLAVTTLALHTAALAAFDDLEKSFDAYYRTGLDTANVVAVENLTLQKDAMTLLLKKGVLVSMLPIEGEVTGAIFVGEGTASLTPPTPMDTWFLKKNYGAPQFSEKFTALFLRFSDGTEKSFPKPPPGADVTTVTTGMDAIVKTFKERQGVADGWLGTFDMDMHYLDNRIGGIKGQEFFYSQFQTEKWGWVTFLFDLGSVIEVKLGHDRSVGAYRDYLEWATFHRKEDYQQGRYVMMPAADNKENIDVVRTDMAVSIPTTKTVEIDAKLTIKPLIDSIGALRFNLVNQIGDMSWRNRGRPVVVESVTDGSGDALPFIHKRDELLVRLPKPIRRSEEYVVRVKAHEDTIIQLTAESYFIYNTYPWYPQYGYNGGRFAFDFTIEIQHPLLVMGSGRIVKEWEDPKTKMHGIELKMDDQVQFPSMLFGRFQLDKSVYSSPVSKGDIAMSVSAFPVMTVTITDRDVLEFLGVTIPITVTLHVPVGKVKGVIEESQNIIKFYENLYGPFPFDELNIAQMAPQLDFGQAPPGLVQLTGIAFLSQAEVAEFIQEADMIHGFLSHEIGHQWWGHAIGWANDEDTWLSESFAEYSSGLYVQALQGERRFQQKMSGWKKHAKQADPVAPIALATAIGGDNAGKYYTQLVYDKGPLVVHMIRMQMGNDNYVKAMTGLMTKYRHQNITTEILSKELGLVTGYNWDYFFDQWFRGVGIPEIHCKWKATPKDGKYLFEMTLSQKDADNFKKILALPVVWHGASKEQLAQKDVPFAKQGQVVQLMLPFEPKSVEVDPNHNLLADVVMDK